jgi:hypothetical protein
MRQQYLQLPVMRESIFMQCIKGVVFAFGAVSSMAGSYFLISAFMAMLAPALLGTPVGWTLLALTIGIGLIFHYMMDNSGMSRVINRDYPSYQALKADWEQFSKTYHDDLNGVYAIKQRVEKKLSVDAETQTELLSYRFFSAANSELIAETPSDSVDYLEIRPA